MRVGILRLMRPVFGTCQPSLHSAAVACVRVDVACAAGVLALLTSSLSATALSVLLLTFNEPSKLFSVALPNDASSKVFSLEGGSVLASLEATELERTGKFSSDTVGSSVLGNSSAAAAASQVPTTVSVGAVSSSGACDAATKA